MAIVSVLRGGECLYMVQRKSGNGLSVLSPLFSTTQATRFLSHRAFHFMADTDDVCLDQLDNVAMTPVHSKSSSELAVNYYSIFKILQCDSRCGRRDIPLYLRNW